MSVYGTPAVKIILNTTDPSGSFILNQYAGPQTGNFWVTGKGRIDTKLGIGGLDPAYALHVATVDPISASFSGRVIGADAVNPNEFITKAQMETAIAVGASLTATQVGYGSPTNTLTGSSNMTFNSSLGKLTLNTATGRLIQLGSAAPVAGPNPVQIHMGGSYSDTAAVNLKLVLYDNNIGGIVGFGMSSGGLEYVVPSLVTHKFYSGTVALMSMSGTHIGVLNSLQIVWEDLLVPKLSFYGSPGSITGYNIGVDTGGILYTNVPTGGRHALRINGVEAFTISGAGASITTVANDNTKTALMVWDSTDKLVRWRSVASVTTGFLTAITADNGLTATTISNVQLGSASIGAASPLLHNTFINTATYKLEVNGGNVDILAGSLVATNTGGGTALLVSAYGGANAHANAHAVRIDNLFTTGNTVESILQILRSSSGGSGAAGVGGSIDFRAAYGVTGGNNPSTTTNRLISKWTTAGTESQFIITGVAAGMADLFTLNGTGITRLNKYGGGLITGTATFNLAVDATGKLIEVSTTPTTAPVHNLLSTIHTDTVSGAPVLGALIVGNGTPAWDRLLGHTVATKRFLTQTGTGVNSAIPIWGSIATADIPSAALTKVDDTNVTLTLTGAPSTALLTATGITVGWTGILAIGRGGTGLGTYVLGDILYASATNVLSALAGNTLNARRFLRQTGTGVVSAAPVWDTLTVADVVGIDTTYVPLTRTLTINGSAQTLAADRTWTITVTGTVNRITVTGGAGLTPTIDIAATYAGQASIVTVGTITTGTWNGSPIGPTYGGTGITSYTLGDTLYASATNVLSKLPGNITTGKLFLSQTGTGVVSAAPVWSAMAGSDITGAALTKTDDTNVTLTLGGTPATALLRAASITVGWTGVLAVTRGGTGLATIAQGDIIYGSAANVFSALTKSGAANMYLKNSGTSNNPAWSAVSAADITLGAALTRVDDTNITLTLGGSPTVALLAATFITVGWAGSLAPGRGGTGITTYVTGDTLYASAANVLSKLTGNITTAKQFLSQTGSGAASAAPVWASITLADIGTMATARILGRVTAGTGVVEQLTGTQATTLIDLFSTTTTTKGVVPGSNNVGSTFFLRADGTWAVPPGAGGGGYTTLTQFVDETAWRIFYSNAAGDVTPLAFGASGQVLQSTGLTSAPVWAAATGGTIGGTIAATQVGYGSGANTLTSSANFTFITATGLLTINTTSGKLIQLGDATNLLTATPVSINMGASYSTVAGANAKLVLFDNGIGYAGIGVSADQLDYIASVGIIHKFFHSGTQVVAIDNVQIGIYGTGQLGWESALGQKMNFFGGPTGGVGGYNMGVVSGILWWNVPTTAKHEFRLGGVEAYSVGSAGTTTMTSVNAIGNIGHLINMIAGQTANNIEVRYSGYPVFQVDNTGSVIAATAGAYQVRLGVDKSTNSYPGLWLGDTTPTATTTNFTLLRGGAYTTLNANGTGGRLIFTKDNTTSPVMVFTEEKKLAIGWDYNTPVADTPRRFNVRDGNDTSDVMPIARFERYNYPTAPTSGAGVGIEFAMSTQINATNVELAGGIASVMTSATATAETFDIILYTHIGGAAATETFRSKSTGEIAVQHLAQDDTLNRVAVWEPASKLMKWRLASTLTGGTGTIMGSLAATQVAYGSAANTITGSNDFNFSAGRLDLSKTTGHNLLLGTLALLGTTDPVRLNLGGSYSTATAGTAPKLILYDNGGQYMGIGVNSAAEMEFIVHTGGTYAWYQGGIKRIWQTDQTFHLTGTNTLSFDGSNNDRIFWVWNSGNKVSVLGDHIRYNVDIGVYQNFTVNAVSIFQVHGNGATSPGTGVESERLGLNSNASGNYSTAFGRSANAGLEGTAVGYAANAVTGTRGTAVGYNAYSQGYISVAVGYNSSAGHTGSVAYGYLANAYGESAVAVGMQATAGGTQSVAIGAYPSATGLAGIRIGTGGAAAAVMSIAIGYGANSSHENSLVIGRDLVSTGRDQVLIGGLYSVGTTMYLGNGVTAGVPVYGQLTVAGGSGTDIVGADMYISGGTATGNAAGGNIYFRTSDAGLTGTTAQAQSTKMQVTPLQVRIDTTTNMYGQLNVNTNNGIEYQAYFNSSYYLSWGGIHISAGNPKVTLSGTGVWSMMIYNANTLQFYSHTNNVQPLNITPGSVSVGYSGTGIEQGYVGPRKFNVTENDGTAAASTPAINLRLFQATAAAISPGFGTGIETTMSSYYTTFMNVSYVSTDWAITGDTADYVIRLMQGGTAYTEKMRIKGTGEMALQLVVQDNALDKVVVWDSTSKLFKYRAAGTIGGGSGGGYTTLVQFVDETAWQMFYSNAAGDVTNLAFGTAGQVLQSNGAAATPTWVTVATGWALGGNALAAASSIGSTTNFDVSFKRNNLNAITLLDYSAQDKPAVIRLDRQNTLYNSPDPISGSNIEIHAGTFYPTTIPTLDIIVGTSAIRQATFTLYGTDDQFFELMPAFGPRAGAFAVIEAWGYEGLRLGSGNGGNTIYFDVGRVNVGRINASGRLMMGSPTDAGDYKLQVTGGMYVDATGKFVKLVGLATDNTATQVAGKDASGNVVWRDVSSISGGGSTTLTATQVGYGSGTNTVTGSADFTFVSGQVTLNKNGGTNIQLGTITSAPSTDPVRIRMGASHSSVAGANPKIILYEDGTYLLGFGISSSQLDYIVPDTMSHNFYVNAVKMVSITSTNLNIYGAIAVAAIAQDDALTQVMVWDGTSKLVKWRLASTLGGGGSGTVTSFAFTNANGFAGSVATPTLTPTLTISTTLTTGSVPFIGAAGALLQDNALFFWDDATKRLGIGNNAPAYRLHVTGTIHSINNFAHVATGGFASFFSNTVQVPAGATFNSGMTWAGGASSNTMQFAGSSTINQGAIIAGYTASNRIEFTAAGATITMTPATGIRAMAGLQILSQIVGTIAGTVTHGASLFIQGVYPTSTGVVNFNNYYGILISPLDEWGVVTFTNRWAIYQQGALDPSYFGGRIQIGNATNQSTTNKLEVTGGFYVNAAAATMRFVNLTTDNTATQVLAKNTAGDNVWRDVASMNKPRVGTVASSTSLTIDSDANDMYTVTALAATMVMNNPSGTPVNGQKLMIRIKDNGTTKTLTWSGSQWRSGEFLLPVSTIPNRTMYLGFIWNSTDSKWDFIAYSDNYA